MKRIMAMFNNLKIRSKFLVSYTAIILISVFMISTINYQISADQLTEVTSNHSEYSMEQMMLNLTSGKRDVEELLSLQYSGSNIYRMINGDTFLLKMSSNEKDTFIRNFLFYLVYSKQYLMSAAVVDKREHVYYVNKVDSKLTEEQAVERAAADEAKLRNSAETYMWSPGSGENIIIERAVYDINTSEYLGVFIVEINKSYLSDLYVSMNKLVGGNILILNESNEMLLYSNRDAPDTIPYDWMTHYLTQNGYLNGQPTGKLAYEGKPYLFIAKTSATGKWKAVNLISLAQITKQSDRLKFWTVTACIISFFIALMIAYLISNNISHNIRLLLEQIKNISEGHFHKRIQPKSRDEIGLLAEKFNLMSLKIQNLIDSVYKEKLLKQEAELRALQSEYNALQSQMNPHFLYNTLETINSMAKINKQEDISNMVCLLGNLLRESVRWKGQTIALREELSYIQDYLAIHGYTYMDKIEIAYDLDEALSEVQVPKFILQPIVENAIIHGIEQKSGKGLIRVSSRRMDGELLLTVSDNGVGMEPGEIDAIFAQEAQETQTAEKHTGLGIRNVDKRIKLLFGKAYGVTMQSKMNEGTIVKITIPLNQEEVQYGL
ncbi:cache domain-containing sensor histidine kinase [Paenibacillus piri]|uniref:histidine kinase n=1 Tax=Paenibacillus piri TaxID=2547395 RepID=A0A4R5KUL1_9BACL|nr:sensor histidine kinase [Paenibacillus piri]TDF98808.1 sensor histidine kinase [Paenibacillus piri]